MVFSSSNQPQVTTLKIQSTAPTQTTRARTHFKTHDGQMTTVSVSYQPGNASKTDDDNNESPLGSVTDKYCSQSVLDSDVQSGGKYKSKLCDKTTTLLIHSLLLILVATQLIGRVFVMEAQNRTGLLLWWIEKHVTLIIFKYLLLENSLSWLDDVRLFFVLH